MTEQSTNLQAEINQYWNQQAAKLGAEGTPHHNIRDDAQRQVWMGALRPLLPPPPADILDVGTGTGFLALLLAELGHRVTGIDLSEGMLADGRGIAAERARAGAATYAPTFKIGDGMEPPLGPASVDVVPNRKVIWTLLDPRKAFGNWFELLRPGGRILAVHHWTMRAGATYSDALKAAFLEKSSLQPGLTRNDPQFTCSFAMRRPISRSRSSRPPGGNCSRSTSSSWRSTGAHACENSCSAAVVSSNRLDGLPMPRRCPMRCTRPSRSNVVRSERTAFRVSPRARASSSTVRDPRRSARRV